ncbi:exonuclease SbcCD subunit D [Paenibacillus tarimensis]
MKILHTADWHLGKLVQGVYMTEDQQVVLEQLIAAAERERPDAVIIAGDLYDRAVPPTEAVELLDGLLERIVVDLNIPVLAIAGNHDSPDRIDFASRMMESRGLYIAGQLREQLKPVVLRDEYGEVHFHLVPYADPAQVRYMLGDDEIRTHDDAMRAIVSRIRSVMDPAARHVLVGHAFVTPGGQPASNTSESERPLAVGGAEHVRAEYFSPFHYTALGHLHQAHFVKDERIRYAGSPLKYSISEEHHNKGFYMVELGEDGSVRTEKRELRPRRDMRRITTAIEEIESHEICEDYVFVTLLNDNPVLFPMEKVRAVYPNALHVERRVSASGKTGDGDGGTGTGDRYAARRDAEPAALFAAFYQEVKGIPLEEEKRRLFASVMSEVVREGGEPA